MGPDLTSAIEPGTAARGRAGSYAWLVFAVTTGLLLSDYMSRQVLNAIFPLLKVDWLLSDTALGSLVGIVAVMVGILTVPLSLLADAVGRVKSIAAMALLWNLATLGCGLATGYGQMFVARLMVGVGAAAFGGVGAAVLMGVFPASMRSTINGAFLAGSIFGSVLGLALGGIIAAHFGWRTAFIVMATFGIMLALCYPLLVSDAAGAEPAAAEAKRQLLTWTGIRGVAAELFATPSLVWALIGSGLQLTVIASFIAWMPSFLHRDYAMATHTADAVGSVFVLIAGLGMILCSLVADRSARLKATR
ncbi:MAG: MFS transporter, partial [Alphaproteobacteria bacterium]|nr:MFS transporter [Alphaproteobacteria bacterium]